MQYQKFRIIRPWSRMLKWNGTIGKKAPAFSSEWAKKVRQGKSEIQ